MKALIPTLLFTAVSSVSLATDYVVHSGDVLSGIAKENAPGPVYGENGSLKKILTLNPQIKNKNQIYPGDVVNLSPAASEPAAKTNVTEEPPITTTPAEATTVTMTKDEPPRFRLGLLLGAKRLGASTQSSFGRDANIYSKLSPHIEAYLSAKISESWSLLADLGMTKYSFQNPNLGNLETKKMSALIAKVGVQKSWSPDFSTSLLGGIEDRSYLIYNELDSVQAGFLQVPVAELAAEWTFAKTENLSFAALPSITYLSKATQDSVTLDSGLSYSLQLKSFFGALKKYALMVGYEQADQKISGIRANSDIFTVGFECDFNF